MLNFVKRKRVAPKKKEKKPVNIKQVASEYADTLKRERFRKDIVKQKRMRDINFDRLRYYLKRQKPHLYRKQYKVINRRKVLREWFDILDTDGSGEIEVEELAIPLISLGFANNYAEVVRIIEAVDDDGSGTLGCDEFISIVEGTAGNTNAAKSSKANTSGKKNNRAAEAVLNLLHALQSGNIGDPKHISLQLLISNYKRKKMMTGLLAYGRSDLDKQTKTKYRQMLTSLAVVSHSGGNNQASTRQSLYIGNDAHCSPFGVEDTKDESKKSTKAIPSKKCIVQSHVPYVNEILSQSRKFNNRGHFTANIDDYQIYRKKKLEARVRPT